MSANGRVADPDAAAGGGENLPLDWADLVTILNARLADVTFEAARWQAAALLARRELAEARAEKTAEKTGEQTVTEPVP